MRPTVPAMLCIPQIARCYRPPTLPSLAAFDRHPLHSLSKMRPISFNALK
jgi:hypothetical protein